MKRLLKRVAFRWMAYLATTWPTSIFMEAIEPQVQRTYFNWFQRPTANQLMAGILQSQNMDTPSAYVDIPDEIIDDKDFLGQLSTYMTVDEKCGQIDNPPDGRPAYMICLLTKGHQQPHFTFSGFEGGIESEFG